MYTRVQGTQWQCSQVHCSWPNVFKAANKMILANQLTLRLDFVCCSFIQLGKSQRHWHHLNSLCLQFMHKKCVCQVSQYQKQHYFICDSNSVFDPEINEYISIISHLNHDIHIRHQRHDDKAKDNTLKIVFFLNELKLTYITCIISKHMIIKSQKSNIYLLKIFF